MKTMLTVGVAVSTRPCFSPSRGFRPGESVTVVPKFPSRLVHVDGIGTDARMHGLSTGSNAAKVKSVQEYPSKEYSIALNQLYNSTAGD